MTLEEEIFKKRELNTKKLLEYGFIKKDDYLEYQKLILNNNFEIVIKVKGNKITGKIIDKEFDWLFTNDFFILHFSFISSKTCIN